MHLPNLTPEALTILASAIGAAALLIIFFLVPRFRRIKDEGIGWDDPIFCTWRCQECGAEGVIVTDSFDRAKSEAPYWHDQLLTENAPTLLNAYRHYILVTQEK